MALTGIDVSRHQGSVNWQAVRSAGHTFAFIKATDGIGYSYIWWFHQNMPLVKAAGLVPGAYHFLLDHHPGEAQARYYVQEVNRSGGFDGVVPIVDIEREADGTTPRIEHLRAFVAEFRRLVPGRPILIYTGRWYWVGVIGNPFGADLGPLWHSEYDGISPIDEDVLNGPELDNYGGWSSALVWQHTSSGSCPGVNGRCDLNLFYGTADDLLALAGGAVLPPKDDEEMWIHASQFTGVNLVDGGQTTWLSDPATVNELTAQGVKVFRMDANADDAHRFINERGAGVDEALLASERAQEAYLAAIAASPGGGGGGLTADEVEDVVRDVFADAGQE